MRSIRREQPWKRGPSASCTAGLRARMHALGTALVGTGARTQNALRAHTGTTRVQSIAIVAIRARSGHDQGAIRRNQAQSVAISRNQSQSVALGGSAPRLVLRAGNAHDDADDRLEHARQTAQRRAEQRARPACN